MLTLIIITKTACYDSLQYVYRPVDRRSLVNIGMVPSGADTSDVDESGEDRGTANPDTEWQRVYYYCTDHIGSTRLVLDDSARIAERLMFLPTGEVFKDERNSSYYHSDFLFSGKEIVTSAGTTEARPPSVRGIGSVILYNF